jgi:hypothetical protein
MATGKTKKNTRRARAKNPTAKPGRTSVAGVSVETRDFPGPSPKKRRQRIAETERPQYQRLPNVIQLTKSAFALLAMNRNLILGIALWYGLLNLLLVRGFGGGVDIAELKAQFSQSSGIASGFSIFGQLVSSSSSNTASEAAGAYQTFLVLITSLALVWSFRQLLADGTRKLRVRDSFYQGMYPLIPVLLVLLIISLQLIPMLIGSVVFGTVIANGIAVTGFEVGIWLALLVATAVWSLLWITPSVFALYIVTLPEMTPLKALRSAKKLLRFRRLIVLRKLLFLPVLIFLLLAAIIIPIIFVVPVLAQWAFLVLSIGILPAVHAYGYTLYRELLNE